MFAPWSPQPLRGFNECLVSPPLGRPIFAPRLVATAATQFRCISLSPRCSPQGLREFNIFILRSLMVPAIAYVQCIPVCSAPGRLNHVFLFVLHFFWFLPFWSSHLRGFNALLTSTSTAYVQQIFCCLPGSPQRLRSFNIAVRRPRHI